MNTTPRTIAPRVFASAALAAGLALSMAAPAHAGYTVSAGNASQACQLTPDASTTKAYQDMFRAMLAANEKVILAQLGKDPQLLKAYQEYSSLQRRAEYDDAAPLSAQEKKRRDELELAISDALRKGNATDWELLNVATTGVYGAGKAMEDLQARIYAEIGSPVEDTTSEVARLKALQPAVEKWASTAFATFVAPKATGFFQGAYATADQSIADAAKAYAAAAGTAAYAEVVADCRALGGVTKPSVDPADPAIKDAVSEGSTSTGSSGKDSAQAGSGNTGSVDSGSASEEPAKNTGTVNNAITAVKTHDEGLSSWKNLKTIQAVMAVVTVLVALFTWLGHWPF